MKKKMKKASYGKMRRMMGGDYMEPSKELKFGAVKGKKPKRRKAGNGDIKEPAPGTPGTAQRVRNTIEGARDTADKVRNAVNNAIRPGVTNKSKSSNKTAGASAARRRQMEEETTRNSPNPPASAKGKGTPAGSQAAKDMKKNPYAEAKKRDPKLDSYIRQRKGLKKGTPEYNAVQNKINAAYGKGPTNRPTDKAAEKPKAAPETMTMNMIVKPVERGLKFGDSRVNVKPEDIGKAMAETGLRQAGEAQKKKAAAQTSETKSKPSKADKLKAKAKKIKDRRAKAQDKKFDRQDKRSNRSADRMFNKNERQGTNADNKQRRMDNREDNRERRKDNKAARQQRRDLIKEGRDAVKQARKMTQGGPRKRAMMGVVAPMIAGVASNAMQNSDNPTMQKIGKGLGVAGQIAGMAGGGGGGGTAKKGMMKRKAGGNAYGPKAKKGMMKYGNGGSKFGMLSVKAGIDNNPEPTQADRIAGATKGNKKMSDRRSKARYGMKKKKK